MTFTIGAPVPLVNRKVPASTIRSPEILTVWLPLVVIVKLPVPVFWTRNVPRTVCNKVPTALRLPAPLKFIIKFPQEIFEKVIPEF